MVSLVAVAAVAVTDNQRLTLGSGKQFPSPDFEYEYLAGSVARGDGSVWMVIGTRAKGQLGGAQQQVLWRIDGTDGEKHEEIEASKVFGIESSQGKRVEVRGLAVGETGKVVGVATDGDQLVIVSLEEEGIGEPAIVEVDARAVRVERLVSLGRQGLLLLGRSGKRGWALAVRESGGVRWEQTYREFPVVVLTDGIAVGDGTIVAGSSLGENGETGVWLARLDSNGEVVQQKSMPGRYASIARAADGGAVILYDVRAQRGWDLFLRALDRDLVKSWEVKVDEDLLVMRPFRLGSAASGELTIVGAKGKLLWIASFDSHGKRLWSHRHKNEDSSWQRIWNFDLLAGGREWIVPYTELVVGADQEQRQVVGLLKLRMK